MSAVVAGARAGRSPWRWLAGGLAVAFGLATLVEGAHTLFGGAEARAAAGDVVPFVLAFNFTAGFFYVAAGVAAMAGKEWAVGMARAIAIATLLVFAALGVHVLLGGAFAARTPVAMTLRTAFWFAQWFTLRRLLRPRSPS